MAVDPLLEPLLQTFLAEVEDVAGRVSQTVLEIERGEAPPERMAKAWTDVARGLHTLKGTSATFGLADLSALAHALEDVVDPFRRAGSAPPAGVADGMLRALDAFVARVRAHATGREAELPDVAGTIAALQGGAPAAEPAPVRDAVVTPDDVADAELGQWRVAMGDVVSLIGEVERVRELRLRIDARTRDVERALSAATRGATRDLRGALADVRRGLASDGDEAGEIVGSLEDRVKAISTLPARTVLDPLQRAVRDLCRRSGKRARLSIVGGELSLDRRLLETLRAALSHLVRNAVDHGIELPDERERAGKHTEGALVVRIEQHGNTLLVEVADDGRGIDTARVREEALRRGVVSEAELARSTRAQIDALVFRPGFTTRREVSDTSGRGVGLDVVRARVAAANGHVEVESLPGQSCRFILSLPSELGSSSVLVVRCGEQLVGIPMHAVDAVVAAHRVDLRIDGARATLAWKGREVRVLDLGALLGLRGARLPEAGDPLLVLEGGANAPAILADEVLRDAELVVRPLPDELRALAPYHGAANTTSGDLLLVLRPQWLTTHDPSLSRTARRALVVDDSLTARALHRTVLEAGGFVVHTASSAKKALELVAQTAYDVAVFDVSMEGMDGFALLREVRAGARAMPVVLVSARDDDEVRERARGEGASAFLTKRDCASGRLLAEVDAVLTKGAA